MPWPTGRPLAVCPGANTRSRRRRASSRRPERRRGRRGGHRRACRCRRRAAAAGRPCARARRRAGPSRRAPRAARTRSRRRRASSARCAPSARRSSATRASHAVCSACARCLGRPQRARLPLEGRAPAARGAHERAVGAREPVEQVEALADVGEGARRQQHAQRVERPRAVDLVQPLRERALRRALVAAGDAEPRAHAAQVAAHAREPRPAPPARRRRARASAASVAKRSSRAARSRGPVAADAVPQTPPAGPAPGRRAGADARNRRAPDEGTVWVRVQGPGRPALRMGVGSVRP